MACIRGGRTGAAAVAGFVLCVAAAQSAEEGRPDGDDLMIGGPGGVYFLAEPGELRVEISKRERNRRRLTTELHAILAGPDRAVVAEAVIPDDGVERGPGAVGRVLLTASVPARGVYALNVTVSQDRYGDDTYWGFRTNCPKYVIETARGHRDERHREPIVLVSPERAADVCFLPRDGTFALEVKGLPGGSGAPVLYDSEGTAVATLAVRDGVATASVGPTPARTGAPWRLHLPTAQAVITIDGLTQWDREDPRPNQALWSPRPESWFPFPEYRHLITPYRRIVYGAPGSTGELRFSLRHTASRPETVTLTPESDGGAPTVVLEQESVTVPPGKPRDVSVRYTVPEVGTRTCRIRVTPEADPAFSTYATVELRPGPAPAESPLDLPLALTPYMHENEQLGYLPRYPTEGEVYFAPGNRPYFRIDEGIAFAANGAMRTIRLGDAVPTRVPPFEESAFPSRSPKIAFDRDGDLYMIATGGGAPCLLHSPDGGETFAAYRIPGPSGSFDIEQFSGHNTPDGPPPFVRIVRTAKDPNLRWRSLNDLDLFVPTKKDGIIEIGEPVRLTTACIGLSAHSGIPSTIVSRGSRIHVAWGEATDPEEKAPGVPTFVATYDRDRGLAGKPVLVGHGPPANDVHNSPGMTMDSKGTLHVLIGTHGRPFGYVRSLVPNSADGGWTEPVPAGEGLNQTYVGLVCGQDDTLHAVFRLWRAGVEPYPLSTHATLAYQRKRPGKPWEPPKILVVAPFSEYSIFYHRLTIDRQGRLFLSKDYWSTYWFYRNDHVGNRRSLLFSPDAGDTWQPAALSDLIP